ncbi:nucleotidyltransferase family protein [Clostridium sp. BL-8]|uniref:nucleotidyltransferase family protein n=1 Tax=Clostridium sp. BL-8 TaxID=349938 RepID=UPI00098BF1E6|nr:nucleotidyltransferase family protein [Clostridium sp. BL-8]OOM81100.1 molybdenum cofactor cytidylyltransferase [Clostridium sp. BL-8]
MGVDGVILAAGYSSRANAFKMELEINKKAILQRCIESLYDECDKIIVVSGYKNEKINKLVEGYAKVKVVYNEEFHKGMFSSVKKGIRSVTQDRFLLTPGDYPLISKEVVKKIVKEKNDIVIPSYNNKGGHPILLSSSLINDILAEDEGSNLKIYLSKKKCSYLNIDDIGILMDVDTDKDYESVKETLIKKPY